MRQIILTERTSRICRLRPADRDYLLTYYCRQLDVMPTGEPGHYRLTPGGWVGVIQAPHCRFQLRPKLAARHLFHLLDPAEPLPAVGPLAGAEVLDYLTARFVHLLRERIRIGLRRGYVERNGPSRFLQGSLDLTAQLRQPRLPGEPFHCRHEEFTVNIPCNRIPRAVAERLASNVLVAAPLRTELRQLLQECMDVEPFDLAIESWPVLTAEVAYAPLLDLCRLLAGTSSALPAFLLPMERIFERYVCQGLRALVPPAERVQVQPSYRFDANQTGPTLVLRPDAVIFRNDAPYRILDAKWKRRVQPGDDAQQMLAYCLALGVRHGTLVYPGRRERRWIYHPGDVMLEVRQIRIIGTPEECKTSLQRLVSHS